MNKPKDSAEAAAVNALDVGRHFLTKYYNAMASTNVDQVVHFYSDASNVKRFGKPAVSGLENIKTELVAHRMENFNVRIFNTICLNSLNDSIIIQVSGEFVQKNGETRPFIQNVVLASQGPGKYYIFSDMVEWLSDLYPEATLKNLMNLGVEDHEESTAAAVHAPQYNGHHRATTPNKHEIPHHEHQPLSYAAQPHPQELLQQQQPNGQFHNQHQQQPSNNSNQDLQNLLASGNDQQQSPQIGRNIQTFINQAAAVNKIGGAGEASEPSAHHQQFKPSPTVPQAKDQHSQQQPFSAPSEQRGNQQPQKLDNPTPQQQSQPHYQNQDPTPAQAQSQPAQKPAAVVEDTGPRTWAKLVSGQIKSNGLPPPTQPPPATFQQTNENNQSQQKSSRAEYRGGQREGGQREGGQREGGNFNKDKSLRLRRAPGDRPPRRDYDNNGGGNSSGGYKSQGSSFNNQNGGGGDRPAYRGSNSGGGGDRPPRRTNENRRPEGGGGNRQSGEAPRQRRYNQQESQQEA